MTDIRVGSAVTMTGVKLEDGFIAGAYSHHWSGQSRHSTALAERRAPGGEGLENQPKENPL